MSAEPTTIGPAVLTAPLREQLDAFLDEHRRHLVASLDDLSEEQARRRLVPSRTTSLGLVKHATFVEQVWFDEVITRRSRTEIGIPAAPDESFDLTDRDTVASVRSRYLQVCAASREQTLAGDAGNAGRDETLTPV